MKQNHCRPMSHYSKPRWNNICLQIAADSIKNKIPATNTNFVFSIICPTYTQLRCHTKQYSSIRSNLSPHCVHIDSDVDSLARACTNLFFLSFLQRQCYNEQRYLNINFTYVYYTYSWNCIVYDCGSWGQLEPYHIHARKYRKVLPNLKSICMLKTFPIHRRPSIVVTAQLKPHIYDTICAGSGNQMRSIKTIHNARMIAALTEHIRAQTKEIEN